MPVADEQTIELPPLPADLRVDLEASAAAAGRSVGDEIAIRLRRHLHQDRESAERRRRVDEGVARLAAEGVWLDGDQFEQLCDELREDRDRR